MRYLIACIMLLASTLSAFAVPPTNIILDYDAKGKILHVSADHPSTRERNFLRRLVIFKNDAESKTVILTHQKLAIGIREDIAFDAKPEDKITVEIYASEGGKGSAEYIVPLDAAVKEEAK